MTSLLRNLAFCGTGREVPVEELGFLCGTGREGQSVRTEDNREKSSIEEHSMSSGGEPLTIRGWQSDGWL